MKYEMKREEEKGFKPFSIKLTFETEDEYLNFHDNVMSKFYPEIRNHEFYGDVFQMGHGNENEKSGRIGKPQHYKRF